MGGVVRRYIDFLIILLIPIRLVLAAFLQKHPYFFVHFLCFSLRIRKKNNAQNKFFYFAWCVCKLCYYSDVIHSFDWKSHVKHDGGV